jgi:hypothetical protein
MGGSRRRGTCRGRRRRCVLGDGKDATHLTSEVDDHLPCDGLLNKVDKLRVVEGCWDKGKRVSLRQRHGERVCVELK